MAHYALIFNIDPSLERWTVVATIDDARPITHFRDLYEQGKIFEAPAEVLQGWVYEHGATPPEWYPPQEVRVITGAEFLARFTVDEINEATQKSVAGAILLMSVRNTVDLSDTVEVGPALDALVTAGVLTTERKMAILS